MPWYNDATLLRNFAEALVNAELLVDADDFGAFLRKPQRYNEEYDVFVEAGYPVNEDEDGWEQFIDGVSNDETE